MNNERKKIAFDLFLWRREHPDNFTALLFDLIAKADLVNKAKIARAYPEHVATFEEYQRRGERFFDQIDRSENKGLRRVW